MSKINMNINEQELYALLMCSLRYASGRQSYVTFEVANIIRNKFEELTISHKLVLLQDLNSEILRAERNNELLGMQCDHNIWKSLASDLTNSLATPKENNEESK